jgi:hypothetical protein
MGWCVLQAHRLPGGFQYSFSAVFSGWRPRIEPQQGLGGNPLRFCTEETLLDFAVAILILIHSLPLQGELGEQPDKVDAGSRGREGVVSSERRRSSPRCPMWDVGPSPQWCLGGAWGAQFGLRARVSCTSPQT